MDQSQNARAVRADLASLVGALVCTVATGFPVLLAGRIVQGISTGIVLPTMYAAIMRVFPPHKSVPPTAWPAW